MNLSYMPARYVISPRHAPIRLPRQRKANITLYCALRLKGHDKTRQYKETRVRVPTDCHRFRY
jgi:hypothetical protein